MKNLSESDSEVPSCAAESKCHLASHGTSHSCDPSLEPNQTEGSMSLDHDWARPVCSVLAAAAAASVTKRFVAMILNGPQAAAAAVIGLSKLSS